MQSISVVGREGRGVVGTVVVVVVVVASKRNKDATSLSAICVLWVRALKSHRWDLEHHHLTIGRLE